MICLLCEECSGYEPYADSDRCFNCDHDYEDHDEPESAS